MFALLENTTHLEEARLQELTKEGLHIIQCKYEEVSKQIAHFEENAIMRKLYLIAQR